MTTLERTKRLLAGIVCLAAVAGCGTSPARPSAKRSLSPAQVVHAFAEARLPLVRILGPPPPAHSSDKDVEKFLERLNDFTSGVNVVGGTQVVFGAARMPSKVKVLVYPSPKAATAALALGQRLMAKGQLPQPAGPVMVRRIRNVTIELFASVYAQNARALQRAFGSLNAPTVAPG